MCLFSSTPLLGLVRSFERLAGADEDPAHGLSSGELCLSDVIAVFEFGALNTIAVDDLGVA